MQSDQSFHYLFHYFDAGGPPEELQ